MYRIIQGLPGGFNHHRFHSCEATTSVGFPMSHDHFSQGAGPLSDGIPLNDTFGAQPPGLESGYLKSHGKPLDMGGGVPPKKAMLIGKW